MSVLFDKYGADGLHYVIEGTNNMDNVLTVTGTGPQTSLSGFTLVTQNEGTISFQPTYSNLMNNLTTIIVSEGVTSLPVNAYAIGVTHCTDISLPSTLTEINGVIFSPIGNTVIQTITFPKNLTTLGANALLYCWNLNSITFLGPALTTAGRNCIEIRNTSHSVTTTIYSPGNWAQTGFTSGAGTSYNYNTNYTSFLFESTGPTLNVKVSGAWKEGKPFVKVNGAWKEATKVYIKVNGTWKESK